MLGTLRRTVIIPIVDERRGNLARRYQRAVDRELTSARPEILATQERKYRDIVLHAFRTVPFYRRHYGRIAPLLAQGQWQELHDRLPLITKTDIRENNADFVSDEFDIRDLRKSSTGGTTASPIDIYLDPVSYGWRQACTRFFMRWYGHRPGDKIAYLWGARQDFPKSSSLKARWVNSLTHQSLMLPSSFLNDEVMSTYYEQLRRFRPRVLQAYPTALHLFAQFLELRGLTLDVPGLITTAEPLLPHQREVIERAFHCRVFEWYGARELGHAASECHCHQGMHVNTAGLRFEVLWPDGTIHDEGDGELLVTDLMNRCMPFIRYRIDDIGRLSHRRCECGSRLPLVESVLGRLADVFKRRDGTLVPGISFNGRIIMECAAIEQCQIIQEDYERFTVRIVKGKRFTPKALSDFQDRIRRYMGTELAFRVEYVEEISKEPSGKTRWCISKL